MSTNTIIAAKMRGKVYSIYCHHDGYLENIIPLLRDHYNTQEKIEALIMMGNTSAIYETLDKCAPYTKRGESYEKNAPNEYDEWVLHEDYYYEYFWDGQQWFYVAGRMIPKPISAWNGGN